MLTEQTNKVIIVISDDCVTILFLGYSSALLSSLK